MTSPLNPILGKPIVVDTLAMDDNFPKLLSNPALLNKIENALAYVGKTYQDVVNEIIDAFNRCNDNANRCFNTVVSPLDAKYHAIDTSLDSLLSLVAAEIKQQTNTAVSGATNTLNTCFQTLEEALAAMPTDCLLRVPNSQFVRYIIWPYQFSQDEWQLVAGLAHWVDKTGIIRYGRSVDEVGIITGVNGVQLGPEEVATRQAYQLVNDTLGSPDPPPADKICQDVFLCGTNVTGGITNHVVTPIVPIIGKIIANQLGTGSTVQASGGVVNVTETINQSTGCVPCPAPIVNVTVLPAPVAVTCPPTEVNVPTAISVVGPVDKSVSPIVESTTPIDSGAIPWEPDVREVEEQLLNAMGFPRDFVLYWGKLSDSVASNVAYDKSKSVRSQEG